jgi:hypothetical protein
VNRGLQEAMGGDRLEIRRSISAWYGPPETLWPILGRCRVDLPYYDSDLRMLVNRALSDPGPVPGVTLPTGSFGERLELSSKVVERN